MTVTGASSVPYYYDPYSSYPQSRGESETVCISESCAASYINSDSEPERTQSFTVSEDNPQTYGDAAAQGAVEGATAIFRILTGCALLAGPPDRDAGTDVEEEADGYEFLDDADIHDEDADGVPDEWEVEDFTEIPDEGWEVDADGDTVTDEVEIPEDGDTDEGAVCTPQPPIVETLFTSGVLFQTDNETTPGSLLLSEAWTHKWKASSGLLPTEVTPAWTLIQPGGGTADLSIDPVTGLSALHINTIGSDNYLYYTMDSPGLSNSVGWVCLANMRLVSTEATGNERPCGFEIVDDQRLTRFDIRASEIYEPIALESSLTLMPVMDTIDAVHEIREEAIGNDFWIYFDGAMAIDGTGNLTSFASDRWIRWGDLHPAPDSESYWYGVKCFNGGTSVERYPLGTYEGIYDLGSSDNNLGAGAYISYSSVPPADTNIIFETRSGNPTSPGDDCTGPITWLNSWASLSPFGGIINSSTSPARCLNVIATLTAGAQLQEFAINYCSR